LTVDNSPEKESFQMKLQTWPITLVGLLLLACVTANSQVKKDISGSYDIRGTGADEAGTPYDGELKITKHEEVFEFYWLVGGSQYQGIGLVDGNTVAVGWANGGRTRDCGVVSYRVSANGKLDGVWAVWGTSETGSELATRAKGAGLAGNYKVSGEDPDGIPYDTTLSITDAGKGYDFHWGNNSSGFGVRQGNNVYVGFGGSQCSWVFYEIKPGGVLDGTWGSSGTTLGTERAVKQR
jgi:hypothetical protein